MARQYIRRGYTIDPATGCWNWNGCQRRSYGHVTVEGKAVYAHRYMYEKLVGAIPEGLQLDHLCRNRRCVNPEHLEPVTGLENCRRASYVRLSLDQVREIRARALEGENQRRIAEEFEISSAMVTLIKQGKRWEGV